MFKQNKFLLITFLVLLVVDVVLIALKQKEEAPNIKPQQSWEIQSIDTVKYSRDPAREYAKSPSFDTTIDSQIKAIASTGANYVSIGTPYDAEFVPFLGRWVTSARKHGLKVWFRGNFSGWEEWFEYKQISPEEHKKLLEKFILDNGNLFEDGDLFTTCTECENGGEGDPRSTGKTEEYRKFLIDEYTIAKNAFTRIGKNVQSGYFPMNYDVARLIMDKETTKALGGRVVIDHYVDTPEKLVNTIKLLEESSGGKIILGEFGAPIPDIHGDLTDEQQAEWIADALRAILQDNNIVGINYWTAFGGSTRIWSSNGEETPASGVLRDFYMPKVLSGVVKNEAGYKIPGVVLQNGKTVKTDKNGGFLMTYGAADIDSKIKVEAQGFKQKVVDFPGEDRSITILLTKERESLFFKIQKLLYKYLGI